MSDAMNAHKKMAMGISPGNKMKSGGGVKVPGALDSSQKQPLPKPTGKIATLKKGGKTRGC